MSGSSRRFVDDGRVATRPLLAGLVLAAAEVGLVLATGAELFLDAGELVLYAATAACTLVAVSVLVYALGSAAVRLVGAARPLGRGEPVGPVARRAGLAAAAAAGPAATVSLWFLSEGRRLRDLPGRPALVVLGGVAVGALAFWVAAKIVRASRNDDRRVLRMAAAACVGVAVAAVVADATLLRRLYPALHWTFATLSLVAALLAVAAWPRDRSVSPLRARAALVLALGSILAAPATLIALRHSSNAAYAVESSAPLTGKAALALRRSTAAPFEAADPGQPAPRPVEAGIDLRDADVLLVTMDALRADRLAALGGDQGLTPHIDLLASEGMVFSRAYTPTPNTSYALGSLLTGKYLDHALELSGPSGEHPTVADRVESAGYRTAAFYPPAIFFVDEGRFADMSADAFGFDHRQVGFVGAGTRVDQALAHLDTIPTGSPVFFWVHLFEPHEPYDPPEEHARGDSAEERYDGEVAAADAAVGRLVAGFRERRPGATVVVTSDHGEEFEEHGGHYHGTTLYDEQVRVPLVWSSPGAVQPAVVATPVDLPDVTTTLLAALGVPREERMRGDDLGPVLAGHADLGPSHAFASIGDEHMVVDGRLKAICAVGDETCRLYDLERDPAERHNVAAEHPEDVRRLRGALAEHLASLPRVEQAGEGQGVWPAALERAWLGDPTVAPDLVPLLGDEEPSVRAEAVRALARFGHQPALPVIARLREEDPDPAVRAQAAIGGLRLGDDEALTAVRQLVRARELGPVTIRGAALSLASRGERVAVPVLIELAADEEADEALRVEAIEALADLEARRAVPVLTELLEHLRLRIIAADALGRIGDRRAGRALAAALLSEPYLPARAAEAEALVRLEDRRAADLVRMFLGVDTPLPEGVLRLLELDELRWPTGRGADLRTAERVREGTWECDETGCLPGQDAAVVLPLAQAPREEARAVFRVVAGSGDAALVVNGERHDLHEGVQEVAFDSSAAVRPRRFEVDAEGPVRIVALAVVPAIDDPTAGAE